MLFYRITAISVKEDLPERSDRDLRQSFSGVFAETSESFYQKQDGNCYIFAEGYKNDKITFGAIINNSHNIRTLFSSYKKHLPVVINSFETEEITFRAITSLLSAADRSEYITDDDRILEYFGIDPLAHNRNFGFGESMLSIDTNKDELIIKAQELITTETLVPEIERIFSGKVYPKVQGHPVHYIVRCDNREIRKNICRTLLESLYLNGRLTNRRYAFTDWSPEDEKPDEAYEAMYKCCEGGAVIIRYNPNNEYAGMFRSAEGCAITGISEIALKYRKTVLTVICLPTEAKKAIEQFHESLENLSTIEIYEDVVSGERAKEYLKNLAKKSHIRSDKMLTDIVSSDKGFKASELNNIFNDWYDRKLRTTVFPQYSKAETAKAKIIKQPTKGKAIDELNEMIGLNEAKAVINKALNFYKIQRLYRDKGISTDRPAMHMVFTGNPGTAKTTVARLFAQIMRDNGVLPIGELIEVGRADLVGKYVGWTAQIVKEKFKAARGSVLFIDEAYSLVDDKNGLYGDEAINTIVQEMENNRESTIVIFAGYPEKMESFINKNPGLRSRIAFHVPFSDYTPPELCSIAELMSEKRGFKLTDNAKVKLSVIFENAHKTPDFGNGRFVRNLIENARMEQANRLVTIDCEQVTSEMLSTLCMEDFITPSYENSQKEFKIGF